MNAPPPPSPLLTCAFKRTKGLLRLSDDFDAKRAAEPLLTLAIAYHHGRQGARLPPIHKHPFDRILIAQCQLENMALVTQDKMLADYNIPIIEARRGCP